MWAAVRQLTGRRYKDEVCDGITAEMLNYAHYARISTDTNYQRPPRKLTATHRDESFVSEWQLLSILDTLPPTATGLNHLYPRGSSVSEPQFSANHLLTCSINLCPHLQFHSSGNTLLYSRSPRLLPPSSIVTFGQYLLPLSSVGHLNVLSLGSFCILLSSPPSLSLLYRPIRISSHRVHHRCAHIAILQSITDHLSTNPFVIVIGLDFSKAFDTLRHDTLLNKMAQLDIADPIYNWLVHYFSAHQHSTRLRLNVTVAGDNSQHHTGLGDRPSLLCRQRVGSLARELHV